MFVVIENKKSAFLTVFEFGYSVDTLLFSFFECTSNVWNVVSKRCLFVTC